MRLSTRCPATASDAELEAERLRAIEEAHEKGFTDAQIWSCFYTLADGSYEVVVAENPAPWDD